jgi:hypothetical protein
MTAFLRIGASGTPVRESAGEPGIIDVRPVQRFVAAVANHVRRQPLCFARPSYPDDSI